MIVLLSLATVAVIYHHNAIEATYDKGNKKGYVQGYNKGHGKGYVEGYDEGYDKGYRYYEEIKDEYNFYHKSAVIVTTTGKKYHKYDCYHIEGRNFYIYNIENARAKGYAPCLDCFE